jgi:prophage regulatory protein
MEYGPTYNLFDRRTGSAKKEIRFIRLKEVLSICDKSRSSVYDAIKKGQVPKPVKLHGRSTAWVKSEVEQWAQECIDARARDV